jgi:hypothetical protein
MPSERVGHIEVEGAVYLALLRAVRKAAVPCQVLTDGAGVRISQHVMQDPDAMVYCGPRLPDGALEVPKIRSSWSRSFRLRRANSTRR